MTNPFDSLSMGGQQRSPVGSSNPFDGLRLPQYATPVDDDDGFLDKMGDFVKFLYNTADQSFNQGYKIGEMYRQGRYGELKDKAVDSLISDMQGVKAGLAGDASNMWSQFKDLSEYFVKTPAAEITADVGKKIMSTGGEALTSIMSNPGSMVGGIANALIQEPIEALNGYKNVDGQAVPMTAEEQYQKAKNVTGVVVDMAISRGAFRAMMKPDIKVASKSGAMMKVGKANFVSGAAGGLAGGAVAGFGEDDMASQMFIATVLSAPLSVGFGMVTDYPTYLREVKDMRVSSNDVSIQSLAANIQMKVDVSKPAADILLNTESLGTMDNIIKAAINSRLIKSLPALVPNITPEAFATISAEFDQIRQGGQEFRNNYVAPPEFRELVPIRKSRAIEFNNDFDRAAVLATKNTLKKTEQAFVDDVLEKAGGTVSKEDLVAHGRYVKARVDFADKNGTYIMPTQPEIDAQTRAVIENGYKKLGMSVEGSVLRDAQGNNWVRQGNNFVEPKTGQAYPINSQELAQVIGMDGMRNPSAPKISYGDAEYKPSFGRSGSGEYFKYYSPETKQALISPNPLSNLSRAVFEATGYMTGEVVVYNGKPYTVKGAVKNNLKNQPMLLVINDVAASKEVRVNYKFVARDQTKPSVDFFATGNVKYLYRGMVKGGDPTSTKTTLGNSIFLTPHKAYADSYASGIFQEGRYGGVYSQMVEVKNPMRPEDINNRITDMTEEEFQSVFGMDRNTYINKVEEIVETASKQGIDRTGQGQLVQMFNARKMGIDAIEWTESIFIYLPDVAAKLPPIVKADSPAFKKVFDGYYQEFKKNFDLNDTSTNFDQKFSAFFADVNLPSTQRQNMYDALITRVYQEAEAYGRTNDLDFADAVKLKQSVEDYVANQQLTTRQRLNAAMRETGMYMELLGPGKVRLSFEDGTPFTVVKNLSEALEAVNRSGRGAKFDLDGGGTNTVPTSAVGAPPLHIEPKLSELNFFGRYLNWYRRTGLGKATNSTGTVMIAFDDVVRQKTGRTPGLFKIYDQLAQAHDKFKNYISSKGFQPIVQDYDKYLGFVRALDDDQQLALSQAAEATTIDDIVNKGVFGRNATPEEVAAGNLLGKNRITDQVMRVLEIMAVDKTDLNTAFKKAKDEFKAKNVPFNEAQIGQGVQPFIQNMNKPDKFKWLIPLEIARRVEDPALDVSQQTFLLNSGMGVNKKFMDALNLQTKLYGTMAQILNLPEAMKIGAYFPHFRTMEKFNRFGDTGLPSEFMNELARSGIMDKDQIMLDPAKVMHQYIMGAARKMSGFTEDVRKLDKEAGALFDNMKGVDGDTRSKIARYWKKQVEVAQGIPDAEAGLDNTFTSVLKAWYEKLDQNIIFNAVNTSLQGLMPGLGIRDTATGLMMMETVLGKDAVMYGLQRVFGKEGIEEMARVQANGIAPTTDPSGMINPSSGTDLRIRTIGDKTTDIALKVSLQPQSYNKMLGVVFLGAQRKASLGILKYQTEKINVDALLDELKLREEPQPVQKIFSDFIAEGKGSEAADFYARWQSRKIVNFYGQMYNPLSWRGTSGRLLGQYGSWAQNASTTFMNMFAQNASANTKIWRASKLAAMTASISAAGAASGLNLTSWLWNPIFLPTGSPVFGVGRDFGQALYAEGGEDENIFDKTERVLDSFVPLSGPRTGNYTRTLVPFSRAVTSWVDAVNKLDEGYAPFQVIMRATGAARIDE